MHINELFCGWEWWTLGVIALTIALLLTACGFLEPRAPERTFTPGELLIDQGILPRGWKLTGPSFPAGDTLCTRESAWIGYTVTDEQRSIRGGTHSVYRHQSVWIAHRTFDRVYLAMARSLDPVSEWKYQSQIAEQSHFGCDNTGGGVDVYCEWGGQYEEYIVVFGARVAPGEVSSASIEQIEEVVKAIDERMAEYLEKSSEETGG